jgi:hypothetical protein
MDRGLSTGGEKRQNGRSVLNALILPLICLVLSIILPEEFTTPV